LSIKKENLELLGSYLANTIYSETTMKLSQRILQAPKKKKRNSHDD
jgi:hypothetical protein